MMTAHPHRHCHHRHRSSREPQPPCSLVGGATTIQNSQCSWRSQLYPACRSGPSLQGPAPSHLPFCASISLLCGPDHPTNSSVLCLLVQGSGIGCWEETGGGDLWQGYLMMNAVCKTQPLTCLQPNGGHRTVMVHR